MGTQDHGITLVTISAAYGAGGSVVGPALARRLGVPFVDRAIPTAMADKLGISEEHADRLDEDVEHGLDRILASFAPLAEFYGDVDPHALHRAGHHEAAEQVIREVANTGSGVILGRAGACVLAGDDRVLHVRLDGPREARIAQGARIESIDADAAEKRCRKVDRAREAYVKRYYRCDARDTGLYDMVLDATRLGPDVCVAVIAAACAPETAASAAAERAGRHTGATPPSTAPASPAP
jgi:cytidylate kinase